MDQKMSYVYKENAENRQKSKFKIFNLLFLAKNRVEDKKFKTIVIKLDFVHLHIFWAPVMSYVTCN